MTTSFDNARYKDLQKAEIYARIKQFNKLYIEVGGKLYDDNHASRVLPGFEPNVKMQIFEELSSDLEVIFCINSKDIISHKKRGDNGLTYADETLRLCDCMKAQNISVCGIMITFYETNKTIREFEQKCKAQGILTYHSYFIENYPNNISHIVSKDGFGKNDHIKTTKKLVLVSAPGANSGKLETCLSQIYNDKQNGISSGYAKYETFPVWNLQVDHLVNIAYEAATAEIGDYNIVDPYYKKKFKKDATNYNRDVESFPVLSSTLNLILDKNVYDSPTEMGINNVGNAIVDDKAVQKASLDEIKRRLEKAEKLFENNEINLDALNRSKNLYNKAKEIYNNL